MGTLSNSFYNVRTTFTYIDAVDAVCRQNLYATAPGQLRRDGKGLSAVCLLPPKEYIYSSCINILLT